MDLVSLLIAIVGIIGAAFLTYLLRKQGHKVAFGFGGSLIFLGLILLALSYELISGIQVWILTGIGLIVFVGFFYILAKKNSPK